MSKVLATTAAIIGLSLGPARAANYHDYHAWSQPTVHDADSYRDHLAWPQPNNAVHVNYHPEHVGPVLFHAHHYPHPAHPKRGHRSAHRMHEADVIRGNHQISLWSFLSLQGSKAGVSKPVAQ